MGKTIHLGAILSLSGEASQDASSIHEGIELAVKDLKKSGCNIEVHYIDDNSDIVTSVRAIDSLVREHNVRAIVGPTWANQVDSFAPIIDQEKIIAFAPAVASDSIIRNSQYLLFGAEKNIYKQTALKDFFIKNEIKKVGVILSQDKWGVSHLIPIKNAALQTGVEIVFIEQLTPYISSFGKKYIKETIDKSLRASPDLIVWTGYEGEADVLVEYLLEKELSVPLIGDQLLVSGQRGEKLEKYKGDLYTFSHHFSSEFVQLFESVYYKKPSPYSDIAYDATMLLADTLSKNETSSPDDVMKKIKDKDYQYQGISGIFVFNEYGDTQSSGRWVIEKIEK